MTNRKLKSSSSRHLFLALAAMVLAIATDANAQDAPDRDQGRHSDRPHFYVASLPDSAHPPQPIVLETRATYIAASVQIAKESGIEDKQLAEYVKRLLSWCKQQREAYLIVGATNMAIEDEDDIVLDDPPRGVALYCIVPLPEKQSADKAYASLHDDIKKLAANGLDVSVSDQPKLVLKNADGEYRKDLIKCIVSEIDAVMTSLNGALKVEVQGLDSGVKVVVASANTVFVELPYKIVFTTSKQ